jgi:hypothetical protein
MSQNSYQEEADGRLKGGINKRNRISLTVVFYFYNGHSLDNLDENAR